MGLWDALENLGDQRHSFWENRTSRPDTSTHRRRALSSMGHGQKPRARPPRLERKQSQQISRDFLPRFMSRRVSLLGLGEEVVRVGNPSPKSS